MIKSHGKPMDNSDEFEYIILQNEDMQFLFNNFRLELKDHNYAEITPGFVSRTLFDRDFQHTINSFHFLIEGEAELSFDGKKQKLSAGDVFLIGNRVKCSWEYTKPSREITLLFNMYLGNLDDLLTSLSAPIIAHGKTGSTDYAETLFLQNSYTSVFKLKEMCTGFILDFMAQSGIDLTNHIKIVKKYEKVFQYITDNLSMNLHINKLSANTNYSNGFFTKTFVKDNGITVKQYIHDKLMSEIEQLLIYTDMSLSEIADKFDFCELSYFSRWFRKNQGCSPYEYRKRLSHQGIKSF